MNEKLPVIEQLQAADGHRDRADLLLRCPDAIVLNHARTITAICRTTGFEAGVIFVLQRVAAMQAVRSAAGGLPAKIALELETLRAELARFAAGAPVAAPERLVEWPIDAPQPE